MRCLKSNAEAQTAGCARMKLHVIRSKHDLGKQVFCNQIFVDASMEQARTWPLRCGEQAQALFVRPPPKYIVRTLEESCMAVYVLPVLLSAKQQA